MNGSNREIETWICQQALASKKIAFRLAKRPSDMCAIYTNLFVVKTVADHVSSIPIDAWRGGLSEFLNADAGN
jgi:hypothetical protein